MAVSVEKRKVVLGITGSIAAYKSAELARIFVSRGYEVRVIMSESAQKFIGPVTLESITGHPVQTGFWDRSEKEGIEHIELAQWADVLVVAPATANVIAKMVAGFADSPLLAVALATEAPILVAPAMNNKMYENSITQENIEILKQKAVKIIDPEEGMLACGQKGKGRLADCWQIFYEARKLLSRQDLAGRRFLITTGPTRESVDAVRYIANRTSGKMGIEMAREAFRRGAEVTLVHGPMIVKVPNDVACVGVTTAAEMHKQVLDRCNAEVEKPDVVVMAAAAADYRPEVIIDRKIKKSESSLEIKLVQTEDMLVDLGAARGKQKSPILVGFSTEIGEMEELLNEARAKLQSKQIDMIVGHFAGDASDLDANDLWLMTRSGKERQIATSFKSRAAQKVIDSVIELL